MPKIDKIRLNNNDYDIGNNNVYSTTEQVVGTWTDGKPLYRKVISVGQANVITGNSYTDLNIPTTNSIRKVEYNLYNTSNFINLCANSYEGSSSQWIYTQLGVVNDSYVIYFKTNRSLSNMYTLEVILEYTKTTD